MAVKRSGKDESIVAGETVITLAKCAVGVPPVVCDWSTLRVALVVCDWSG